MRKQLPFGIALGVALSFSAAVAVMGHAGTGEAKIVVEPATVTAGDTVVLAGSGLEPDNDRVLVLAGEGLTVEFGTIKTDAEGMFSEQLTIPNHLISGNYEFRAIGDETLATPLAVAAAAGGAQPAAANDAKDTVVARERSPIELASILALVVAAALVGGLLIWRAEHIRGASAA